MDFGLCLLLCCCALVACSFSYPLCSSEYPDYKDIREVPADLVVPPLTSSPPSPGSRTIAQVPGWLSANGSASNAYFTLYLPPDFSLEGPLLPVIIELPGNGPFESPWGDTSSGRPEDTYLGFGLTGGRGAVWAAVAPLTAGGECDQTLWWGCPALGPLSPEQPPVYAPPTTGCPSSTNVNETVDFLMAVTQYIVEAFRGDPARVVLAGFSRGAIGVNYLGLHSDRVAALWRASIAYAHYDGQPMDRAWPYPDSGPPASYTRLQRLAGRPQFICAELNSTLSETMPYLEGAGVRVNATFTSTGFCNHNSAWVLRPSPARDRLRAWWRAVG